MAAQIQQENQILTTFDVNELAITGLFNDEPRRQQRLILFTGDGTKRNPNFTNQTRGDIRLMMMILVMMKNRYNNIVTFINSANSENEFLMPDRIGSTSGNSRLGLVFPNVKHDGRLLNRQILRL